MRVTIFLIAVFLLSSFLMPLRVYGNYTNTITINNDGSVSPSDAPLTTTDNITYTLTDNVTKDVLGIKIERSNVILFGQGYTIQGQDSGSGIYATNENNITLIGFRIKDFNIGININSSSNGLINNNTITSMTLGIQLSACNNSSITQNNIDNCAHALDLPYSSDIVVSKNRIVSDPLGISLPTSSTINITISENSFFGDSSIGGYGIIGLSCSRVNVLKNYFTSEACGVQFFSGYNNTVSFNNMTKNRQAALLALNSAYNIVSYNFMVNNSEGLAIQTSSNNNRIFRNIIDGNKDYGVFIGWSSSNNTVFENNLTRNLYGIFLNGSRTNVFVHNNIANNNQSAVTYDSFNDTWDTGFDGNYWSDYNGTDNDQDGIGDTSYVVNTNNTDHFPLMTPYPIPEYPSILILSFFFMTTLFGLILYRRRYLLRSSKKDRSLSKTEYILIQTNQD